MTQNLEQFKWKVEKSTSRQELQSLYEEFVNSDETKKWFQKELKNIFNDTNFDKQKFVSKLLETKASRAIFQFHQKEQGNYNKQLDWIAGNNSQTELLASKIHHKILQEEIINLKESNKDAHYLDITKNNIKERLVSIWLGNKPVKLIDQVLKKWPLLEKEEFINNDSWQIYKGIRSVNLNPLDIQAINKEIRDRMPLTIEQAQNYLNLKTWGKYILCRDCKSLDRFTDDKYNFTTKNNDNITAEWLKKLDQISKTFTAKKLRTFVDNMNRKYWDEIKEVDHVLIWDNNFGAFNNNNLKEKVIIYANGETKADDLRFMKLNASYFTIQLDSIRYQK